MSNGRLFVPFIVCMTALVLAGVTGCGNTLLSGSEEDPAGNPADNPPPNPGPASPSPQNMVWYVSAGGNDATGGTDPARPAASVQAALDRIKSLYRSGKWPAGENAVIEVS
ncbi:MAG: hypothetical protein LBQ14_08980, partial [Treponema sp.]|nr:hypothetical protein [Treponema sp.]